MFFEARRFNFKSVLESSLQWKNNANFPGDSMFNATCSEDRESGGTCGTCGDQTSAEEDHVVACGTEQGGRLPLTTNCTFCADYGDECCMPYAAATQSEWFPMMLPLHGSVENNAFNSHDVVDDPEELLSSNIANPAETRSQRFLDPSVALTWCLDWLARPLQSSTPLTNVLSSTSGITNS